jgi:hypothetical protein
MEYPLEYRDRARNLDDEPQTRLQGGYFYVMKALESGLECAVKLLSNFAVIGSSIMELDAIFREYCEMVLELAQKPVASVQSPVFALQKLHQLEENLLKSINKKLNDKASRVLSRIHSNMIKLGESDGIKNAWEEERDKLLEAREKGLKGIAENIAAAANWVGTKLGFGNQKIETVQRNFDELVAKCHSNGILCLRKNKFEFPKCDQDGLLELKRKLQRKLRSKFSDEEFNKHFEEREIQVLHFKVASSRLRKEVPKLEIIFKHQQVPAPRLYRYQLTLEEPRSIVLPLFDKISEVTFCPSTRGGTYTDIQLERTQFEVQKVIPFTRTGNFHTSPHAEYCFTTTKLYFPKDITTRGGSKFTIQKVSNDIFEIGRMLSVLEEPQVVGTRHQDLQEFVNSPHNLYVVDWCEFCDKLKLLLKHYLGLYQFLQSHNPAANWKQLWNFLTKSNEFQELNMQFRNLQPSNGIFGTTFVHDLHLECIKVMACLESLNLDLKCFVLGGRSSSIVEVEAPLKVFRGNASKVSKSLKGCLLRLRT